MKTLYKSILAAAVTAPLLTGCIEEKFPTSGIIQSQLESSSKATEALVYAMPSSLLQIATISSEAHYQWGNPSLMHIRDVMTEDMAIVSSGYNWFDSFSSVDYTLGEAYMVPQFIWNLYYEMVLSTNNTIGAIDPETTDSYLRSYLGAGYAFRAGVYLDMARMYEFLPNNYTSATNANGNDVTGLTVPIVTEKTTEAESRKNPRAPHNEMFEFILGDLTAAVEYLDGAPARPNKTIPNLSVAYGLMARAYLWDASFQAELGDAALAPTQYANAAKYARLAITTSGATPTTQAQWLNTTTGFNDITTPSWMWGSQYVEEDRAVTSALLNWTSWMSNETTFGYASAGPFVQIGASLYDRISDRDFRKLSWVAPENGALSGRESYIDAEFAEENFAQYYSLKFRPGNGNMEDNKVACSVGIPLMRVEEMYFIEAEATAHTNPAGGISLLNDFMKQYRYATYSSNAATEEDAVEEIILQKRIELWGEGQSFFDVKRLNMDVTRYYSGTNFAIAERYNTNGRPAWMNIVIVLTESNNNEAVAGWNNPTPYGSLQPITGN